MESINYMPHLQEERQHQGLCKLQRHRGISLMSHIGKLYECILEKRLRNFIEHTLSEEQAGFQSGRGTIDQISALRLCTEKCWEYGKELHVCFLDLEKAFDRIPRHKIWDTLGSTQYHPNC